MAVVEDIDSIVCSRNGGVSVWLARKERNSMSNNFGDFQLGVYTDAVKGVNSR
jgi:hypothetical protein